LRYIFLSYKREEKEKAEFIKNCLEETLRTRHINVWWDENIQAGKVWNKVLDNTVKDAHCVVVLWSNLSVKSEWVLQEAGVGRVFDKLVPVKIDNCDIPSSFKHLQAFNLCDWDRNNENNNFKSLVSAIMECIDNYENRNIILKRAMEIEYQARQYGIGIVGASGTGKSTLVRDIREILKKNKSISIETIQGVSRDVISLGYPLGQDAHPESYIVLMRSHVSKLLEVTSKNLIFISERTLLDQFCYSRVNKSLPRPMVKDELIHLMEHIWHLERKYYWKYIYLPVVDDTRGKQKDGGNDYQQQIDTEFKKILVDYKCIFEEVKGSPVARAEQAFEIIRALDKVVKS
jgi:energy-coupling factor transporter ATP-binding protein EcfA2